jgi:predicted ArsR family transcriptional regulator
MVIQGGSDGAGIDRTGEAGHLDRARGPVSAKQAVVLQALRTAGEALSADQVAAAVGIHPNTARFHLRNLLQDGVIEEHGGAPGGRGRPGVRYRMRPDAEGGRSYALLSRMLIDVAADVDERRLDEVGRAWGSRLLAETAPSDGKRNVAEIVTTVMGSVGFRPRVEKDRRGLTVHLTHCPFVEAARGAPGVICTLHRSVLQGVLDGVESDLRVAELVPFATATTCVARLRR